MEALQSMGNIARGISDIQLQKTLAGNLKVLLISWTSLHKKERGVH